MLVPAGTDHSEDEQLLGVQYKKGGNSDIQIFLRELHDKKLDFCPLLLETISS